MARSIHEKSREKAGWIREKGGKGRLGKNHARMLRNIRRTLPKGRIVVTPLKLCPEIKLYLLSGENMERAFSQDEVRTISMRPPYWAFCWASGQVLAYHILKNRNLVAGKCVLDFGSGSGVSAIAAAMAGAKKVIACDMDGDAIEAVLANATLNQVQVDTCKSFLHLPRGLDFILAADVLYDRENHAFLDRFLGLAPEVLFADSRVNLMDMGCYRKIAEMTATTLPDLSEGEEFNHVRIFCSVKR